MNILASQDEVFTVLELCGRYILMVWQHMLINRQKCYLHEKLNATVNVCEREGERQRERDTEREEREFFKHLLAHHHL